MYDQLEANSELDFVLSLRREHGDEYAIATMKKQDYDRTQLIQVILALVQLALSF